MICKYCGTDNADNAVFCANCGASLQADNNQAAYNQSIPVQDQAYAYTPNYEGVPVQPTETKDPGKVFGIISLVLGIVGVVLGITCSCACGCIGSALPFIGSVVGIILGIVGSKKSKEAGFKNTMAKVGMILSIVSIVLIIIGIIIAVIFGASAGFMSALTEYSDYSTYYYY